MKIYLDIGNSAIKIAKENSDEIFCYSCVDDIENSFFIEKNNWIISSVNRDIKDHLVEKLEYYNIENTIVDYDLLQSIDLGFSIDFSKFKTIGIDRVLDVCAGVKKFGFQLLVIDMGTANTYNFVNKNGEFEGGVITPGLFTRLKSLNTNTSDLPQTKFIDKPYGVCHYSTQKAINSGVYFGLLGELKELIKMYENSTVVFSGGCSKFYLDFIQKNNYKFVDNLILKSLSNLL